MGLAVTFAAGTLAGALVRIAWVFVIAVYWEERAARRTYQLDQLPRAYLVR